LRARERLISVGLGLFLAATFVMIAGDLPRLDLRLVRRLVPARVITSPWLYPVLFASAFALLAAADPRRLALPRRLTFLHRPVPVLVLAFLASVLFSQAPSLSWLAFGWLLVIFTFGGAVAQVLEDESVTAATSVVIAAAVLFLAVRVLLFRAHEGFGYSAYHVTNNAWLGKLQIAWVLNVAGPLVLARFIEARRPEASVLYGVTWLASGATIHFLYSRIGAVVFGLTTVVMCALNRKAWRRWLTLLLIAASVGIVATARTGGASIYLKSVQALKRDSGIAMRGAVWRDTLPMIQEHPLTGIGLGSYDDIAYSRYHARAEPEFFRNGWHAHNLFLHVLAETGIVGLAAWCYFWFTIVRFLLRRWRTGDDGERRHSMAALCVVMAFFVVSFTEALIAARVHASLRMNLTLVLLLVYACRLACRRPGATAASA